MPIKTPAERLQDFEKFKPCSCRNVKDVCSQCPSLQEYKDWLLQQFTDLQTEKEEAVKQAVEAKWNQLQRHTIKEKCESMTDWIDWDDVCKVFGKETALEERIREKKAELEALTNKQNV